MSKKAISTAQAPAAIGPYSQGVISEGKRLVFVSGQVPLDPATGQLVTGGIAEQTRRSLENLKAVLAAGGARLDHVVKTTVFLQHMSDFPAMNEVYQQYFREAYPARATVEVAALPKGALVEIEAIAVPDE